MKTIGFFNNKGGVGKTTLLCNLAASLSIKFNKKVLVVDADPQSNASAYMLDEEKLSEILLEEDHLSVDNFYDPVRKGKGYPATIPKVVESERFRVDLIIGDPLLSIREDLLARDWSDTVNGEPRGFQTTYAFKELLSRFQEYDYVLVDMGPSLGALNRSILLATDYFLMPLSVDIFSMMAVKNIIKSFEAWKSDLNDALQKHLKREGCSFEIGDNPVKWNLQFAGYVMQQYKTKSKAGVRQAVGAFDRIIERQKMELETLSKFFDVECDDVNLGEVPTLSSVIPLSQQAHAPIFELGSKDGIVGAHYTRVSEAAEFYHAIAENFMKRVGA